MHLPETDALFAYACAVLRPAWDGGRVTAVQEAMVLAASPVSLGLAAVALFALFWRNLWLTLALWSGWGIWAAHIYYQDRYYLPNATAIEMGCIGSANLFLGLGSAICGVALLTTLTRRS